MPENTLEKRVVGSDLKLSLIPPSFNQDNDYQSAGLDYSFAPKRTQTVKINNADIIVLYALFSFKLFEFST